MRSGAIAIVLVAATAVAEEPQRAGGRARIAPALPAVRIQGSTAGDATIQASLDVVLGVAREWDLALTPTYRGSSTSGLVQLFSKTDPADTKPWALGATVSLIRLGPAREGEVGGSAGSGGAMDQLKQRAAEACLARCGPGAVPDEKEFCDRFAKVAPAELDPSKLCERGRGIFLRADAAAREKRAEFPQLVLSAGAIAGANKFEYVDRTTNPDVPFAVTSKTRADFTVGASGTYVHRNRGLTFELPVLFDWRWLASPWTYPLVVQESGSIASCEQVMDKTRCQELRVFGPRRSWRLFTTAQVGYVSRPSGWWRASIGPLLGVQVTPEPVNLRDRVYSTLSAGANLGKGLEDRTLVTVGVMAPICVNFARAPEEWVGEYKGLARVTPTFLATHGDAGWDVRFLVTIDLLGQRTLFGRALDWP